MKLLSWFFGLFKASKKHLPEENPELISKKDSSSSLSQVVSEQQINPNLQVEATKVTAKSETVAHSVKEERNEAFDIKFKRDQSSEPSPEPSPVSERTTQELRETKALLLNRGDHNSLWFQHCTKESFAKGFFDIELDEVVLNHVDHCLQYIRNVGIPLRRAELLRLLGQVELRLPYVWELQALHTAKKIHSHSIYWTRDSRDHLWSPSEGRWRSVSSQQQVSLTCFWTETSYELKTLEELGLEVIDAQACLENLASQTINDFDFGLSSLGVSETEFQPSQTENTQANQAEPNKSKNLINTESNETVETIPQASLQAEIIEIKPKQPSTQPHSSELTQHLSHLIDLSRCSAKQKAFYGSIPTAYAKVILPHDHDESLSKVLAKIKLEAKVARKEIESYSNMTAINLSLRLGKLERELKKEGLQTIVLSKFETTRPHPRPAHITIGTYNIMSEGEHDQEKLIIAGLKRNDPVIFRQFIELYQRPIYLLCFRFMSDHSEAEDMSQETFIRASQAINQFRGESSLRTWLYRIASNLCKNRLGYLQRRQQHSHDHLPILEAKSGDLWQADIEHQNSHDQPEQSLEGQEAQNIILKALQSLPKKQRTALTLRDIDGLSYTEIAEMTQSSLGTVKSRIHQGRQQLAKTYHALLNGEEGED